MIQLSRESGQENAPGLVTCLVHYIFIIDHFENICEKEIKN